MRSSRALNRAQIETFMIKFKIIHYVQYIFLSYVGVSEPKIRSSSTRDIEIGTGGEEKEKKGGKDSGLNIHDHQYGMLLFQECVQGLSTDSSHAIKPMRWMTYRTVRSHLLNQLRVATRPPWGIERLFQGLFQLRQTSWLLPFYLQYNLMPRESWQSFQVFFFFHSTEKARTS